MPDLRPARQDHKLLSNRSTEKENRSTGQENKSLNRPLSFEDIKKHIDEEESNRLVPLDGYTKPPQRPREEFGLQLRPQHDDINEYFTGPKWHDPNIRHKHTFVEEWESRPLPPAWSGRKPKPKPKVKYREEGEKVSRDRPPPPSRSPDHKKPEPEFVAKNIRFNYMDDPQIIAGTPAKFADPTALVEINDIAKYLQKNPNKQVKIRASVGLDWWTRFVGVEPDVIKYVMRKRAEAVSKQLEAFGIDPARISTEYGKVGSENDRIVEFEFSDP
jgi:hypothetical protein